MRFASLTLGLLALGLGAAASNPPVRALRWLAAGADAVAALTRQPSECLPIGSDKNTAVEIGRAAFGSPLLLGGQASRAGLSCESCHRSGRGNVDFHFPGVSGPPGTADVTSALFSSHRGDGIDNPKAIPDLSAPKSQLKIDQSPASDALERFITGLIVEEFNGAPPPPAVLAGLAAYVRALSPNCPAPGQTPISVASITDNARRAVAAAQSALTAPNSVPDRATAEVMLLAARGQLGALNERFTGPELAASRAYLSDADADLLHALTALRADDPKVAAMLKAWQSKAPIWQAKLFARERLSLFNPAVLQRQLP